MQNLGKKLEIFVIVVAISLIGIIYAFKQKPAQQVTQNTQTQQVSDDTSVSPIGQTSVKPGNDDSMAADDVALPPQTITYQGVDGKNALELLQASHEVVVKHYSFGDMVESIDGMNPDSKHFWALYVNDQFSQVGASSYITKSTDNVKWELDAIVDTTK